MEGVRDVESVFLELCVGVLWLFIRMFGLFFVGVVSTDFVGPDPHFIELLFSNGFVKRELLLLGLFFEFGIEIFVDAWLFFKTF